MIYYLPTICSDQTGYECLAELAKATTQLRDDVLEWLRKNQPTLLKGGRT